MRSIDGNTHCNVVLSGATLSIVIFHNKIDLMKIIPISQNMIFDFIWLFIIVFFLALWRYITRCIGICKNLGGSAITEVPFTESLSRAIYFF